MCFGPSEEIPSDEDEVNENQQQQQQQQASPPCQSGAEDDDEDDYWDDDGFEGTPLEEYSTPLDYDNGEDEYLFFTSSLLRMSLFPLYRVERVYTHTHTHLDGFFFLTPGLQNSDAAWYHSLMAPLSEYQKKQLQEIYNISQQRGSSPKGQ